jgi:hypothetical protein
MKTQAKWFALGALCLCVMGATFKRIGDLPITTNPSANSWMELDDLSASPRSVRYQLSRLATTAALSAGLTAKQNAAANLTDWAALGTNVLSGFLPLTGGTLSGALTVNADVAVTGVVTVTGGSGASTFSEVTSTNGYNKETQAGLSFTLDVANSDGTTNRLVVAGGIIVSNIANF